MESIIDNWAIPKDTIINFYRKVEHQYKHFKCEATLGALSKYLNLDKLLNYKTKKLHVIVASLGFHTGGGELFPINLANSLLEQDTVVSLFILDSSRKAQYMYDKLDKRISVFDKELLEIYGAHDFIEDAAVALINTHMVSLDLFFWKT